MSETDNNEQDTLPPKRRNRIPCPQCGKLNILENKFCIDCGHIFGSKATQSIHINSKATLYANEVRFTVTEMGVTFEFISNSPDNILPEKTVAEISMHRASAEALVKMMTDAFKELENNKSSS